MANLFLPSRSQPRLMISYLSGFSNGNTIQSRQTSRKYDEIGMQSPDNVYDELHNDLYLEPI
ncbi:Hypothetical predicted protein [Mytilus galloprovincialis]|uniref:Uncharacterized protein n=1 Tax=Mytilus galloprovincialis TaxID=29158 RepID=A0A8B6DI69_MYTGA|nr:Hypothetical predicted protein [Mytilus galloprovincialis]